MFGITSTTMESVRDAAKAFMQEFQIEDNENEPIWQKFNILKSTRDSAFWQELGKWSGTSC